MAKQSLNRRETKVSTEQGEGQQLEQVLTVEEYGLPSPQELVEYQKVDPRIVDFLIETSTAEQKHRHQMECEKINLVKNSERSVNRMNWWGMFFAFLALISVIGLAALALYLDKPWFASVFGVIGIASIVSVFVEAGKPRKGK